MDREKKLYDAALQKWGAESQIEQTVEECAELIVALKHWPRGKANASNVASELADVEIMCGQMRILLGDILVDEAKSEKLDRLEGILK